MIAAVTILAITDGVYALTKNKLRVIPRSLAANEEYSMSDVRDSVRGKIFALKTKTKVVSFNGVDIEIRQPAVKSVIAGANSDDKRAAIVRMLVDNCYVPGTEEKVFEDADYDSLMEMPFGHDWMVLSQTMDELTDISASIKEQAKN
jgi:hypothetical protein